MTGLHPRARQDLLQHRPGDLGRDLDGLRFHGRQLATTLPGGERLGGSSDPGFQGAAPRLCARAVPSCQSARCGPRCWRSRPAVPSGYEPYLHCPTPTRVTSGSTFATGLPSPSSSLLRRGRGALASGSTFRVRGAFSRSRNSASRSLSLVPLEVL
ncbi:Hypothetical protein CAP_4455 [Chondromyces apiculatus DSM 436]|uniref:Uncharacterized protein n=1 Tax=Chondromyces apiculatus DSM 436 TaxID=1192034 RepID=A0A017T637_9BACT|nr:Hypothetical protein CAP_4455 [Chondromyces apiculatus DSM 436]